MANPSDPRRILIVLPNWVGDVVMATPALRAIRDTHRTADIALLMRSSLAELVAGSDWCDEVMVWPSRRRGGESYQGLWSYARRLKQRGFDTAVLLTNSFRSALSVRLAGIPRRIGYARDGRTMLLTDRLEPPRIRGRFFPGSMIEYYRRIAEAVGCKEVPRRMELAVEEVWRRKAEEVIPAGDGPLVVISPGASYGSAKCWYPDRFAAVGDRLIEECGARVVISCGPAEVDIARAVAQAMRRPAVVLDSPVLGLGRLKALVERSDLLICNDTGPRHFAVAFDKAVVTLFGSTYPEWTESCHPRERKVMVAVDCGPCMQRRCPLDHRCMTRISAEDVTRAATELLSQPCASF